MQPTPIPLNQYESNADRRHFRQPFSRSELGFPHSDIGPRSFILLLILRTRWAKNQGACNDD